MASPSSLDYAGEIGAAEAWQRLKADPKAQLLDVQAGIELSNPIIAASGTFGYGIEFEDIVSLDRIGGLVTKGLSREPMAGNEAPRIIQTASGMMNAIGLQTSASKRS